MANYVAYARTNYVKVSDMDTLKRYLQDWPISVYPSSEEGYFCFICEDPDGAGWPGYGYDEDDNEIEFLWEDVMQFIEPGQVLVALEVGAEKLRYLTGIAEAYIRTEDGRVLLLNINLHDIYQKARETFQVEHITTAEY